jgi:HEXXH motif-containing protein
MQRRIGDDDTDRSVGEALYALYASAPTGWDFYHPVFNYLHTSGPSEAGRRSARDLQLVFWLGSQAWADPDISVEVSRDSIIWSRNGARRLVPNTYSAAHFREDHAVAEIGWDVAGMCTTTLHQDMWPQCNAAAAIELPTRLATALASLDNLRDRFGHIADWAAQATRLIVPLRPRADGRVRSESLAHEIGSIYIDLSDPVSFLESVVHESSHQHFYLFEQVSALVSSNTDAVFYSPLRKQMRPVRGVFLAYHALAGIAQLYRELLQTDMFPEAVLMPLMDSVRSDLESAASGMKSGREHLTNAGAALFGQIEAIRSLNDL